MRIRSLDCFVLLTALLAGCVGDPGSGVSIDDPQTDGVVTGLRLGRPLPSNTIVFVSSRAHDRAQDVPGYTDVFAMDLDGGNVVQLTFRDLPEPYGYEHAAISPDRRHLAVAVSAGGDVPPRAYVYDLDCGTRRQLLPTWARVANGGIDWAPDGTLFFAARESPLTAITAIGEEDIYASRADGSGFRRVARTTDAAEADVSVSDDGRFLAFVSAIARTTGGQTFIKPQIAIMRTDGTGWQLVYDGGPEPTNARGEAVGGHDPELSPDGRRIAFSRVNSRFANFPDIPGLNTAHDIYVIDVAGTNLRRLTPEGAVQILPDWRGDTLLYMEMSERDRFIGLVLSDTLGVNRRRIGGTAPRIWDGARAGKLIP
jgi:Tol biopolymer transport system component